MFYMRENGLKTRFNETPKIKDLYDDKENQTGTKNKTINNNNLLV